MLYRVLNILYTEVNIVCSEVNMMFILIFDISVNNIVQFTVFYFSEVYCAYSELLYAHSEVYCELKFAYSEVY